MVVILSILAFVGFAHARTKLAEPRSPGVKQNGIQTTPARMQNMRDSAVEGTSNNEITVNGVTTQNPTSFLNTSVSKIQETANLINGVQAQNVSHWNQLARKNREAFLSAVQSLKGRSLLGFDGILMRTFGLNQLEARQTREEIKEHCRI